MKTSRVGKSGIDIAGLHLLHLHDRGATCNTLYLVDEVHETDGRGMTDVIDAVRNGAGRKMIQKRHDAGNDVINVGEVATQIAMIENANGLTRHDVAKKEEGSHVGTSPRTIDREETKSRGRNAVEFGIGVRHQFVAFLCGSIETDGSVGHLVFSIGSSLL